jgi:hypothetical protein
VTKAIAAHVLSLRLRPGSAPSTAVIEPMSAPGSIRACTAQAARRTAPDKALLTRHVPEQRLEDPIWRHMHKEG